MYTILLLVLNKGMYCQHYKHYELFTNLHNHIPIIFIIVT